MSLSYVNRPRVQTRHLVHLLVAALLLSLVTVVGAPPTPAEAQEGSPGLTLTPATAERNVGQTHTVTAVLRDFLGAPIVGIEVNFTVVSGPNAGAFGAGDTDANGEQTFSYTGFGQGQDLIQANLVGDGETPQSATATVDWIEADPCTAAADHGLFTNGTIAQALFNRVGNAPIIALLVGDPDRRGLVSKPLYAWFKAFSKSSPNAVGPWVKRLGSEVACLLSLLGNKGNIL